jgi:IclR family acetate operon transcriptional repressor
VTLRARAASVESDEVEGPPVGLSGADRVLACLKQLSQHPKGVALEELARELHSPKSSVHRALAALRRAQLAEQDERGRYRLGLEVVRMGLEYYDSLDRTELLQPLLDALAQRYQETTHYAELDGGDIVYLSRAMPPALRVQMTATIGGRNPAYCTGLGKALLAEMLLDEAAVQEYATTYGPLERRTPNSITDVGALQRELDLTRRRGYALDDQESDPGINCIAFAVHLDSPTRPFGAVSVSALSHRTPLRELIAAADEMRALITQHLGARALATR